MKQRKSWLWTSGLTRNRPLPQLWSSRSVPIERIEMFPEKRKDGSWIKKIVFNFPVPVDGEEVKELPLETETTVECVIALSKDTDAASL